VQFSRVSLTANFVLAAEVMRLPMSGIDHICQLESDRGKTARDRP
jgi:hypothetical protein